MEKVSTVSVMLQDAITNMFSDWPDAKDMLIKGKLFTFLFFLSLIVFYIKYNYNNLYILFIYSITNRYIST